MQLYAAGSREFHGAHVRNRGNRKERPGRARPAPNSSAPAAHSHPASAPHDRGGTLADQADGGRHHRRLGRRLPRRPRGPARRRALARERRSPVVRGADAPARRAPQRRPLGGRVHGRLGRPGAVDGPGVGRRLRRLARRDRAQARGRPARHERRDVRGDRDPQGRGRARVGRGRQHARGDRRRPRVRGARAPGARREARRGHGARRRALGGHGARQAARRLRRPRARAVRLLVRAVPALVRRLQGRPGAAAAPAGARLRRPLPAPDPSDRPHAPQGPQQHARRRAGGPRQPVGDRRRDRRPRRDPPRARHDRRLRRARGGGAPARHRHRARLRDQRLRRPPVAEGPPGVVQPPARRHDQVRGEPAQEVPGHLQPQLEHARLEEPVGRAAEGRPLLGRSRRAGVPRRQPAHQAAAVLGVAHRRDPLDAPGDDLPRRGVHPPGDDARARQARLHAVLHVLHVEELQVGARGVPRRARAHRRGRVLPAQLLRQHAGHPHRLPRRGRAARVRAAADPRRHAEPDVRHLLRLRELRARPAPRGGGVHRQREVRDQAAPPRRPAAPSGPAPQPGPPRQPRAAAPREPAVPRHAQRRARRLRQAPGPQPRDHRRQRRPAQRAGGARPRALRAGGAALVHRHRPDRPRPLRLAHRRQLRASRPVGACRPPPPRRHAMTPPPPPSSGHWFESDPLWFKRAVFYEIHLRGFFDANADGSGDFRGLTDKLDYLQWLGIDVIWLLPMYASPLRDGGYDIADYKTIHPDYGTIEDVRAFIEAAHERGIRVIADLVMNHTSSDHEWFQRARSAPPGSSERDWYVWSDTVHKYEEARIIFTDTETSNWTWDDEAGAYYWHRFFSHQPDLNFDNVDVQEAMLDALRFWLDLGLDGFRLDAVPYLYERDGTNGENLPETHDFLKKVRATVDAEYPDRVLLAEANQWPEDVVEYFGDGDECHMAFHFPVMPRMFMSVRREEATPIYEILDRTPAIPDNAQWGLFLRNHDELTLEMVTDEERDYMYEEYAKDPRMKINLGIRRRLAPLLDNGRDEIELMHAILFSLPGSPVLYYGDEIGMGDNVYLGDRDGVRTPMQWAGDRNAGFSRADWAQLYLQPLMDPVYGYQAINVEAQLRTPTSVLRWLHRFIALRKEHPVFGLGTYEPLQSDNPKIFAHIRRFEEDIVLCVHNVARSAQAVQLDLSEYKKLIPEEMFGRTRFPAIGDLPYLLTLAPRGFFWFQLRNPEVSRRTR